MSYSPYSRFSHKTFSLTDHLAIDRTVLANERTMLAYIRTALALVVIGVTCHHFLTEAIYWVAGTVFLVLGGATFVAGIIQFWRMRRRLAYLTKPVEEENP
jgi:putative membrane protein